jgi:hypothetical protein
LIPIAQITTTSPSSSNSENGNKQKLEQKLGWIGNGSAKSSRGIKFKGFARTNMEDKRKYVLNLNENNILIEKNLSPFQPI